MKTVGITGLIAVAALVAGVCSFITMPEGRALDEKEKMAFRGLEGENGWELCKEVDSNGPGSCKPITSAISNGVCG